MQKIKKALAGLPLKQVLIITVPLLIIVVGASFIDYSADQAGPGSGLYSLDKTFESVRRSLPKGAIGAARFELEILEERFIEFNAIYEENSEDSRLNELALEIQAQQDRLYQAFENARDRFYAPQDEEQWLTGRYEAMFKLHALVYDEVRRDYPESEVADSVRIATQKYRATAKLIEELEQLPTTLDEESG